MLNSPHFFLHFAGSDTDSSPPFHDRLFHKQQLTFCNNQHDLASISSFKMYPINITENSLLGLGQIV